MFVKRTAELNLLEEQYASDGSSLVILYGRRGMGKTTLLREFLSEKGNACYYAGAECEDQLQLLLLHQKCKKEQLPEDSLDYLALFTGLIDGSKEKLIIVLDEFHYMIKNESRILDVLQLLGNAGRPVMIVLSSSSIRWVENEMLNDIGSHASYITAYLKLKELTFVDFVNRFPDSTVETCIYINALLGGIPEYLDAWQEKQSLEYNIKNLLLNKNSGLFHEPQRFLKLELREPAVYNTILYFLASGYRKLNDLHARTGYSRAKISVYLKNLIQLDIVEKLVPFGAEGKENAQKGLYRIKDNFLSFWFRFVFPNTSELMLEQVDTVYRQKVVPYLDEYMKEYFADVCTEFLKLMNLQRQLPAGFLWWDRWYGKNGIIDILAQSEDKKTLVAKCLWGDRAADRTTYQSLLALAEEAGVVPDYCYLFSKIGFDRELSSIAEEAKNLFLIRLEDL